MGNYLEINEDINYYEIIDKINEKVSKREARELIDKYTYRALLRLKNNLLSAINNIYEIDYLNWYINEKKKFSKNLKGIYRNIKNEGQNNIDKINKIIYEKKEKTNSLKIKYVKLIIDKIDKQIKSNNTISTENNEIEQKIKKLKKQKDALYKEKDEINTDLYYDKERKREIKKEINEKKEQEKELKEEKIKNKIEYANNIKKITPVFINLKIQTQIFNVYNIQLFNEKETQILNDFFTEFYEENLNEYINRIKNYKENINSVNNQLKRISENIETKNNSLYNRLENYKKKLKKINENIEKEVGDNILKKVINKINPSEEILNLEEQKIKCEKKINKLESEIEEVNKKAREERNFLNNKVDLKINMSYLTNIYFNDKLFNQKISNLVKVSNKFYFYLKGYFKNENKN